MKTDVTVVTERGQISIPASVRKQMHIVPGTPIVWSVSDDCTCTITLARKLPVRGAKAMLGFAHTYMNNDLSSDQLLAELREGESV
ncbi:MAG: AbrB/MazE/SpoVT family DNA-binding domain-containing protein [Lentisphaerae bacterium]|jgi:AbrB family looped-hinge helix DNA binding protein|nr:AbrB/MazE/SpoVT family DNA-binding domain-containing protein [Lentisphaerota bacterium]